MPATNAKKFPTSEARRRVVEWFQALRDDEIKRNAGDPGIVLARRLSNAEYNYTIRDLTGVDIRPTREFPVDPANTAGFDNSGESLTMSPALLKKYLEAAREVANHMVLKPSGLRLRAAPDAGRDRPRQVLRASDHRLLPPAEHRLRRLLPGGLALQASGGARQARRDAGRLSPPTPRSAPSIWRRSGHARGPAGESRPAGEAAGDVARACRRRGANRRRHGARKAARRCATTSCSCARSSSRGS